MPPSEEINSRKCEKEPAPKFEREFLAFLPISLEVSGSFHQLATFISGIAALPRIVTIHEMKLEPFPMKKTSRAS